MKATAKMKAYGLKRLHEQTGHSLSIMYRWVGALEEGRGIADKNKRKLIALTQGSEHAITWADFEPELAEAAA